MIPISKSKFFALAIYLVVNLIVYARGDAQQLQQSLVVLGVFCIPIFLPSLIAWFARWGLMESLARDFGNAVPHSMVSFFYWLLLIIASLCFVFNWSLA